jgi:uncharacterized YigZ family protein
MLQNYKTIYKQAEIELFEKGSRFIGHAFPINANPTDAESIALKQLNEIKQIHKTAHHNCFAYQIGDKNQFVRQSDDGEPSGTAGMPILDFIKKQDLKNILIVVTRYFGGTLLGTGGLVRAYGRAAKEAATAAVIIEKTLHQKFNITAPYHLGGKLEYEIRQKGFILTEINYTDNIDFVVLAKTDQASNLTDHITNITANTAIITQTGTAYTAQIDGKTIVL